MYDRKAPPKQPQVEWRKNELLALCSTADMAFNERIRERFDNLIAAVEEQTKERIRALATPIDDSLHQMSLVIPYSVLAPTKEKP